MLSNIAVKSRWCQFEIDRAILCEGRRQRRVIVIKLGDDQLTGELIDSSGPIESGEYRSGLMHYPTVAHLLDTHNYLEWVEKSGARKLFWARIVAALYGDMGGCGCCCPYGAKAIRYHHISDNNTDH